MANCISTNKTYTFIFFQQNCTILFGKNNTKDSKSSTFHWFLDNWKMILTLTHNIHRVGKFSLSPLQLMEAGMIGGAALPVLGRGQWSDLRLGIEMGDKWSGPGPHIAQCRFKLSGVSATVFWAEQKRISVNSDLFSCVVLIKQLKHDYMQLIKRMT